MRQRRARLHLVLAALCISLGTSQVLAHSDATGIVKERMELMKSIGAAMKSLTAMMRGEQAYDPEKVRAAASEIAVHGGKKMTELFPEGSLDKPSEALPAIWQDWDRFSALAVELQDVAEALGEAADNERMSPGNQSGGITGDGMMGGGTMGGGTMGGGMMGNQGGMMGGGTMMAGRHRADPALLATMPPDAAFIHLAQTCADCHRDFRVKK